MQICHFLIDCLHKWQFFSLPASQLELRCWILRTFQKYLLFEYNLNKEQNIYELNEKGNKKSSETKLRSITKRENFQNTAAPKGHDSHVRKPINNTSHF